MDDQLKICRLCFRFIRKKDYKSMEDELVMVTAIFLDLVNWEYSENPLLCNECVENLHKSYDFKSTCLMSEEKIYTASGCKQDDVDLWQIRNESESKEFRKNKKICRLCLNLTVRSAYFQLEEKDSIHLMLQKCLPELDLVMVREPVICQNCFSALERLFNFIVNCLSIEENINVYRDAEGTGSNDKVNLYNVLEFTKIKKKSDVDDTYIEESMNENETETVIKLEKFEDEKLGAELEVLLKTEPLAFEEESATSVKMEHIENQTETGELRFEDAVLLPQSEVTTRLSRERKCVMPDLNGDLSEPHVKNTSTRNENTKKIRVFQCDYCSFQTNDNHYLESHLLNHKGPSEVIMYKCDSCSYQTNLKGVLKTHLLVHKSPSEVRVYKCDSCSFQTKHKGSLTRHTLVHKSPSEVTVYKCESCKFQSKVKNDLTRHLVLHKSPSETKMYKCYFCPFQAKLKSRLKTHLVVHKSLSDVAMYKCASCSFQTKRRDALKVHLVVHKDPSEVKVYKCNYCSYQAKQKGNLKMHLLVHDKDPLEVKIYKCYSCSFETKWKENLKKHMQVHRNSSEVTMYKCDSCSFQTKLKSQLTRHVLVHESASEVTMYKCHSCSFQTKRKCNLTTHLLVHKSHSEVYRDI